MRKLNQRQQLLFLLLASVLAIQPALAESPVRIAAGTTHEGPVESRNASVEIGDDARINGEISSRNGSVRIGNGVSAGDVKTRNGGVRTGSDGLFGDIESRNGSITLGANSQAGKLETRNGGIEVKSGGNVSGELKTRNGKIVVGENATVAAGLEARNGAIELAAGVIVEGNVQSRNGHIHLQQAQVKQNVSSRSGDLVVRDGSRVGGDLVIEIDENAGNQGWFGFGGTSYPEAGNIEILQNSEVAGNVIVRLPEDYDREIPTVTIDDSSRVLGEIIVDERVSIP